MQPALLATKLHIPPIRPEVVSRPRLVERLNAGPSHRLTLVSAPAGFGKTTLVGDWVRALDAAPPSLGVAWLSLDEDDNDPTRFLTYLIAALQARVLGAEGAPGTEGDKLQIGKGMSAALQSPQPPSPRAVLTSLINEVAALPHRIVLVLDDYHLIEAHAVHDALRYLVQHLPPQLHLVLATREDPPLPLARLRARGQLTELRARDLRFTSSEAAEFLHRVTRLVLLAEEVAALETRTEGWIAGLQLAALSMRCRRDVARHVDTFTGSHRYVLDYLIEEVLEQQPESIQTFLLRTSILERMSGPLCDAVCFGDATLQRGQAILERLEHANLFIVPLDEERRWYRYHHLFADLLRQRLRHEHPDWEPRLQLQASRWYEQNGFADEAIEHALRAEAFQRAADLLEDQADAVWRDGEHAKLWRWVERLPAELLSSRPHLCVFRAWSLFARGQVDAAAESLDAAEQALGLSTAHTLGTGPGEQDAAQSPDRKTLRGRIAVIRASLAFFRGDLQGILEHARRTLTYLPEQDVAWRSTAAIALGDAHRIRGDLEATTRARFEALEISNTAGNLYMILLASMKLAVTLRQQGQLRQVQEICEQQLQRAETGGLSQTAVAGGFLAVWGEALAEVDDLSGALRQSQRGVGLAQSGEEMVVLGWSYLCLMRVLLSREDWAAADELIREMESHTREADIPPWIRKMMAGWQVRGWLAQGKMAAVSQWMAARRSEVEGDLPFLREFEEMVVARVLLAQARGAAASRSLQRLLEAAEAGGRTAKAIEIGILQALAYQVQGDTDHALHALEKALLRAEPGGFIRIFVDEGPPMARLLHGAVRRGVAPDYVRRLLAAFPGDGLERTEASQARAADAEWVEPLSEREVEVLELIANGLTNREIGARLFLALNTVKAHARNIYGKLGVHNRTQAVARGRALGILPPN